jgi:hypothetical protein
VDNAVEVAAAQELADAMSHAHQAIVAGESDLEDYTIATDGFQGFPTKTVGGVPAQALIGARGSNCLVMHWTAPFEAQLGRLEAGMSCSPGSIDHVPLTGHEGYVAGTGPPFDVTALVRVAHTPIWFVVVLVILFAIALKAVADLVLVVTRPDRFDDHRRT